MKGPERRQTPRTTVEEFAYINIEPNNAGSVLNVSEEGLRFHSIAPVQSNRRIRFWFSEHNRRVEVDGELAWTDETRKTGGSRFTTLPAEAREQIRNWITPPTTPLASDEASAPSVLPRRAFPVASASRSGTKAASGISEPLAVVSPRVRVPAPLRGFSGGLATGLLVSALVMAACLFHSYRRQFGESLIQLGERLGARPQAQMQLVSPAPQTALPARRAASPPPVPIPLPRPEKPQPQALADPAKLQWKLEPARPATAAPSAAVAHAPALKAPAVPGTVATTSFRAVEDCLISWESYSANAIVKFVQDDYVVATANGRWVNRALRFEHDAFVYRKNDDGSRTLIEIRFAGMRQALVFDKLS